MITILLIEDDDRDAAKIKNALHALDIDTEYSLVLLNSIAKAIPYLETKQPDLILLDLEMREEKTTTLNLLDRIDQKIPIIIISNLLHYQKPSLKYQNVRDFISKKHLDKRLPNCILQILFPSKNREPDKIVFPTRKKTHVAESFPIYKISFIELIKRDEYNVYFTSGNIFTIKSVSFKDLIQSLQSHHIYSLRPVSRNEIININYISYIGRNISGRIELTLVGYPKRPFHPGKQWAQYFEEEFF